MRIQKLSILLLSLGAILQVSCKSSEEPVAPVMLSWQSTKVDTGYENVFTIKNVSEKALTNDWAIYFAQFPRAVTQNADAPVKQEQVDAQLFRLVPGESYHLLNPGDSVKVILHAKTRMQRNALAPEGPYWVGSDGKPIAMTINAAPLEDESVPRYPKAAEIYEMNSRMPIAGALTQTDIIPSVKDVQSTGEVITVDGKISLVYPEKFSNEAEIFQQKIANQYGIEVVEHAPLSVIFVEEKVNEKCKEEAYQLSVTSSTIKISAETSHGIFNGTQTLLAMLKGQQAPYKLQEVVINDYPDLSYRGFMMDIARNFTTVENLKHLIDLLASYKMNVLHFHFSDDEAWRLEIPGLEELTAMAACRGYTLDESECLLSNYGGGFDYTDMNAPANGYYTRAEFIDFLQYAKARHIRVIPEIESPGHARAAVVAMKNRYKKYAETDMEKAMEYMLVDLQDTSRYVSVQHYDDNVMDVSLPSTLCFMQKVILELKAMYDEAGVELPSIHLGGDEVPKGAWLGSPSCHRLMKEKGMTKRHDLAEYFITQVADFMNKQGIKFSGWQEVALGHSEAGHNQLREQVAGVYCWNTVPDWGGDQVVYQTANNGYPVILCNVCNFYMDLAYNFHPDERGLDWGGVVDETKSYAMLPYRIYRSCRTNTAGVPYDLSTIEDGKPALTPEGRKNIVGVQAQLFTETIRGYDWVQYYLFPKYMGLVERGWNAFPTFGELSGVEEEKAFYAGLAQYEKKIAEKEMTYWTKQGINFRIAQPGLLMKDGMLYANVIIPGAEIRYTLDGSEPNAESALWTVPVKCEAKKIRAKAFYQGKESYPITLWINE